MKIVIYPNESFLLYKPKKEMAEAFFLLSSLFLYVISRVRSIMSATQALFFERSSSITCA